LLNIAQILDSNQHSFVVNDKKSFEELLLLIKHSAVVWSNTAVDIKGIDILFNGDIDERVKKRVHHLGVALSLRLNACDDAFYRVIFK
jgi:hypothetical protein